MTTLGATYYGAQTIGGSSQATDQTIAYAIPVTVLEAGLAVAIEMGITGGAFTPTAMLLADNGGVPGNIIALFQGRLVTSVIPSVADRFVVAPIMAWVTAGDYWIAFQHPIGLGGASLRYTTGSSGDGYEIDGAATALQEPASSGTTLTATDRQYSLRLVVLALEEPTFGNLVKFELTDTPDPGIDTDHVLRIRMRKTDATDSGTVRIRLMEGVTEIASFEEDL